VAEDRFVRALAKGPGGQEEPPEHHGAGGASARLSQEGVERFLRAAHEHDGGVGEPGAVSRLDSGDGPVENRGHSRRVGVRGGFEAHPVVGLEPLEAPGGTDEGPPRP